MAHRHNRTIRQLVNEIVLTTINAKWIHPSLALRLLKANLGSLEEKCEIIELNLRQPLREKVESLLCASPRILGLSVSIWNHLATLELLAELEKKWQSAQKPVVVLGGPEVSHLPPDSGIFRFADYVIRGEGEEAFRLLCENVMAGTARDTPKFINGENVNPEKIKSAYHLYTDEDIAKKLIYVEASRGCPFNCEFCMSALDSKIREFPLETFLAQMDALVRKGVRTFKFLDRSFNVNIKRALKIIEFFLEKIEERKANAALPPLEAQTIPNSSFPIPYSLFSIPTVHFEMVPSLFPNELREALSRFPPESLRLEIGIQSLNREVCARIGRPSEPEKELKALRFLSEKTNAIIHADLIAGLPGENLASFGSGFDRLWLALYGTGGFSATEHRRVEIQTGILKLLPGAPIARRNEAFGMRFNPLPPYEIEESAAISSGDLHRIRNFARFWELVVNRGLVNFAPREPVFDKFMALSDTLLAHFGRNWGIDRDELREILKREGISG